MNTKYLIRVEYKDIRYKRDNSFFTITLYDD
ncbi:hypothetical protein SAMN05444396_104364 [Flavobacterium segetis]|uniref:Uncharacterized protein n=1 Tax=Flavobacterium segetis TaxID=271157 RepID=A0A1M5H4A5_9FLAO|nr:hypothetical protein SAMN05444396_104364 [Flavobacterium segetis]